MKHIKTFLDKVKELKELENRKDVLVSTIRKETNEMVPLIVDILNDINIDVIKIHAENEKYIFSSIYHVEDKNQNSHAHLNGMNTLIYYKNKKTGETEKDLLWNFNSSSSEKAEEIALILQSLIDKYPENYKNTKIKKDTNKFNI